MVESTNKSSKNAKRSQQRQAAQDAMRKTCNVYDEPGTIASLAGKCTFCGIISQNKTGVLLYQDEHIAILRDKREKAEAHYQCIPKRHIKNFTWLKLDQDHDVQLLNHMQKIGIAFLKQNHPAKVSKKQYSMGFHKPDKNSQYHLHLHLVVWPLKDPERHQKAYGEGKGLVTVQSVYEIFN